MPMTSLQIWIRHWTRRAPSESCRRCKRHDPAQGRKRQETDVLASASTIRRSSRAPLVIGLVNNMPDLALRATERQFCALLSAASHDFVVRLKLFTLPNIPRSDATLAHIARTMTISRN